MAFQIPEELIFLKNSRLPQQTTNETMTGKVVVLSGGTSGVGLATLRELAKGGATVLLVSRNQEKAARVTKEITDEYPIKIINYYADFSKLQTVRDAAQQIVDNHPRIDVLINSAGIHSTRKRYNEDGFEMVFCVNHLAPFLFTQLLLPRLKESAPSRILQINSEGHRFAGPKLKDLQFKRRIYTGLRSYGASKTAQLMTVWELADQLEGTGVTILAVHPGAVKSNIGQNNGFLYRLFSKLFTQPMLKDPIIAGQSIYYLACAQDMEGVSGKFYNLTIEEPPAKHARNRVKGAQIYDASMALTGLSEKQEREQS